MGDLNNFYNGKPVIVTGASGFIGSHVCKQLISLGASVKAFVQTKSNLWRLDSVKDDVDVIPIDMMDDVTVGNLIALIRPEYIFHFAIPPHSKLRSEDDLDIQTEITSAHLVHIFEAIERHYVPLKAFVHACSGAIYQWDNQHFVLNEKTPLKPSTLRGMLKLSQRNLCLELAKKHHVDVKLARIFRAYGPWEVNSKLIVKALDATRENTPIPLGSDDFKRDYIYINDLVDGILSLGASNLPTGIEMNFGSSTQYTAREIIEQMEDILGREIPKQLGAYAKNAYDQGNFVADCNLAKDKIGWEPKVGIKEGLKETVEWYKGVKQWS